MKNTVYSRERGIRILKDGISIDDYRKYLSKFRIVSVSYPAAIRVRVPSIKTLEKWSFDGICKTPDGCRVEPDGICPHGYQSWLLILGYI
jgi:hypothetical protein